MGLNWHFCPAVLISSHCDFQFSIQPCITASVKWKEMSSISKSPHSSNAVSFVDWMELYTLGLAGFIFSACFRCSEWLPGTNWLQTWVRLKLSFWKWQGADLTAWHWAIGHHTWQMGRGTKLAGCKRRQNAFSQSPPPHLLSQLDTVS